MPLRVVWAWEEPEDLETLSPTVGVAYLAETLILTDRVNVLPRMQPLTPAPGAVMMAVVRIEARRGFTDSPALRNAVVARIVALANRASTRVIQVDFDATDLQHNFYTGVLEELRKQLPAKIPLSMTALVSWCGPTSWLHNLPVQEAVPMYFRMGGLRAESKTSAGHDYSIQEPLCRTSIGLSTDEPWPTKVATLNPATRIYLFAPHPWRPSELKSIAETPLNQLALEVHP